MATGVTAFEVSSKQCQFLPNAVHVSQIRRNFLLSQNLTCWGDDKYERAQPV
jgi:hypothetical protein